MLRGFVLLNEDLPFENTHETYCKIEKLYIHPEDIGKGYGAKLMHSVIQHSDLIGVNKIWLEVMIHNTRAISFYKNFDFSAFNQCTGKFKKEGRLDIWLRKKIN